LFLRGVPPYSSRLARRAWVPGVASRGVGRGSSELPQPPQLWAPGWYVFLPLYNTGQDTECIEKDREKVSEKRFMMTEILSGKFQGFKAFR